MAGKILSMQMILKRLFRVCTKSLVSSQVSSTRYFTDDLTLVSCHVYVDGSSIAPLTPKGARSALASQPAGWDRGVSEGKRHLRCDTTLVTCIVLLLVTLTANAQSASYEPKPGDLLFQDIDCGELCDAIETVTKGVYNSDLSHVGIVDTLQGKTVVLEAVSAGVKHTAKDSFLARSTDANGNPKVIVGRLKKEYRHEVPDVLRNARKELGKPYDRIYDMNDSAYYCSELVHAAFTGNNKEPLFQLYPMTFKSPDDTTFFPAWVEYYRELDHPIPQGEWGLNPGSISRSDKLEIVHVYGYPDGWNKNKNR